MCALERILRAINLSTKMNRLKHLDQIIRYVLILEHRVEVLPPIKDLDDSEIVAG